MATSSTRATSAAPSAVITSGWDGDPGKRTIKPGETDELKFKFKNNAANGDYAITVDFDQGCSVSITYKPGGGRSFTCSKPFKALTMKWNDPAHPNVWVTAYQGTVAGGMKLTNLAPVTYGRLSDRQLLDHRCAAQ